VVERVKENMLFLEDPESIEAKGGYVPGGLLLWGPPGTGKTLMAEAVAGETGRPYVFVDPGAFINMFMGVGILKVKALFRKLRKLAVRYGGVIVFFDEADSLGNRGMLTGGGIFGGGGAGSGATGFTATPACNGLSYLAPDTAGLLFRQVLASGGETEPPRGLVQRMMPMGMGGGGGGMGTLQALLTELSGLKKPRGFVNRVVRRVLGMRPKPPPKYRILVMMATNMPQALDEALLRPGRIDRIYKVGYPSKAGRVRTYQGYFDKVSHGLSGDDIDKLATITPYSTGASIKDLVNEALINAIRSGRQAITWEDVIKAKQLKDLGPPEDVEYIERERHAVAVHEACHAVVAYRARHHLTIDIATIEKGGTYLGMVASIPPEDQFTRWRSEYEADVMVSVASLAGERMFFDGDSSSGVSGDLEGATQLATLMEGYWGMGTTVTSHGVTQKVGIGGGGKPGDNKKQKERNLLEGDLGNRIESKLAELLARTERLLADNRTEVLAVAHALETHKTVTGDDVEAVIEGREGALIDGRPYRTRQFAKAAESYHSQVVAAHKGHGRVEVPLPVLNGQRVELQRVGATVDGETNPATPRRRARSTRRPKSDG
jgi:ATP-dependent Zn protease